jgi:hypothetical protein
MTELTALILDEVRRQRAIEDVVRADVPELRELARRLVALVNDWDDALADAIFADNVVLDDTYERRQTEIARVVDDAWPLTIREIRLDDAADATVRCTDATGRPVDVALLVAPPLPRRIQNFEVERP